MPILARSRARKAANGRGNGHPPQPVLIMGEGDGSQESGVRGRGEGESGGRRNPSTSLRAGPKFAIRNSQSQIVRICNEASVRPRIIPGMYEILGGTVSVSQLRDVRIEDLLRRELVHTDTEQVTSLLRGKRILVTGAALS